ncbi:MAG TPA: HD domain-containing protein [Chitinophagaceae bacterium]|nr:HD domain-containing protein [Chitinophagaceae bacterium]HMZ46104.1 HD domain-containing protein [Chitinophagaceae bacterium]HNF30097.1 HD domain-containing protein [Chitinophagaceae bacterium]HNM34236.1 HD domain-containing protein [Chitinophagaceae bacterium]HNN31098.1 HD domain-containing protein [Chitinophagaceae bacterium]
MIKFKEAKEFITQKQLEEIPKHFTYHSLVHILIVYESCKVLAEGEGITGIDLQLLLTAALFHDSGFIIGPKNHEETSCEFARQYLPQFNYTNEQIEHICDMIMATKIPQSPKDHLGQILADADLDYLGRDDFYTNGNKLFEELKTLNVLKTEREWYQLQINFLEKHNYFTATAIRLRKEKKHIHLNELKNKL